MKDKGKIQSSQNGKHNRKIEFDQSKEESYYFNKLD